MSNLSKRVRVVFTLSVLLNVLLLGLAAGQGYKMMMDEPKPWDEVKENLAPETRDLLKSTLRARIGEIKPVFQSMREQKKALEAVLMADTFDSDAFEAVAKNIRGLEEKIDDHKLETVRALASQLPAVERRKMAKRFVQVLTEGGSRGKKHGDHSNGGDERRDGSERHEQQGQRFDGVPGGNFSRDGYPPQPKE
ncbi:MAG: periplasmic heavy metal sensor [Alphaproteobacteria bacterium]|nr:periplasmic heavy metal sensor [Alphaproteobacteria bacterium]